MLDKSIIKHRHAFAPSELQTSDSTIYGMSVAGAEQY